MALTSYRELEAWQKSMDLAEAIYELAKEFPVEERYGLTSQLRRAAVSVPSNIAEGYARDHRGEYIHHLSIARGSLAEAETQITLAVRLGLCEREAAKPVWAISQEAARLLSALITSLRK